MSDHAISNARAWLGEIVELTTKLDARRESSTFECGQCEGTGEIVGGLSGDSDDEECPVCDGTGELEWEDGDDADAIEQQIHEGPLSIQVRGGWHNPGDINGVDAKPEEFAILLSTGGPALRLYGQLDEYGGLHQDALLQWQDWGTPWTTLYDITEEEQDALNAYVGCHYLGE